MSKLNPSAKSFSFNPKASTFTPSFSPAQSTPPVQPPPQQQPQQQQEEVEVKAVSEGVSEITISPSAEKNSPSSPTPTSQKNGAEEETTSNTTTNSSSGSSSSSGGSSGSKQSLKEKQAMNESKIREEKLKNVDTREHLNIVFIGHVDAGKSTLSGQLLVQTGQVDARTMQKNERDAKEKHKDGWAVAFVMDSNEEERDSGTTVEVARAHFETVNKRYTVLDAPGHKAYVPNMIGGASQADVAVLVVSARKGEFETGFEHGGQTREHSALAKTLGVNSLLVAVNKMDDQTVNWSEDRFKEIVKKMSPFFKSVGFNPKTHVKFVPLSGLSGLNTMKPVDSAVCPWWKGGSFVEVLDGLDPIPRPIDGPLRLPVVDKFKEKGNTIVLGKIESGTVYNGQKILIMPSKAKAEIIDLKLHDNTVDIIRAGENAQFTLKGDIDIGAGSIICDVHKPPVPIVQEFVAQFIVLDKPIFAAGFSAMMHLHTSVEEVTVTSLMATLDKKTGKKLPQKPRFAKSGDVVIAKLMTKNPVCMEKFETLAQLGRFTIREERTVIVGKVTMIKVMNKEAIAAATKSTD